MTAPLAVHQGVGVRWTEGDHPPLPRSYGDAAAEYQAVRAGAAVIDRCDRGVVRLHGRDPLRILQGMLSNDVTLASPTRAVYAALLTPKGKMVAEVRVLRRPDDFLLEVPAAALPDLVEVFKRSVPPLFARWEDVSDEVHVLGVYGPAAAGYLGSLAGGEYQGGPAEDATSFANLGGAPAVIVRTGVTGGEGYDIVLPTPDAERAWHQLVAAGARPVGHAALDVLRIEAGVPGWGAELTGETIPLEAGLKARAISLTKGCYTGQEVIIRILHRGHVNWLLRGVLLGECAGVQRETPLLQPKSGRPMGRITSSAWSPRLDQEIALAYVRREVEPGSPLELAVPGGPPARVVALPFTS